MNHFEKLPRFHGRDEETGEEYSQMILDRKAYQFLTVLFAISELLPSPSYGKTDRTKELDTVIDITGISEMRLKQLTEHFTGPFAGMESEQVRESEVSDSEIDSITSLYNLLATPAILRLKAQLTGESKSQVIYQNVAAGLGIQSQKTLMFLLAKRCPILEMKAMLKDLSDLDAVMEILSCVGNLPTDKPSRFGGYFKDRVIPKTARWQYQNTTQQEMLLALATWVSKYGNDPLAWVQQGCPLQGITPNAELLQRLDFENIREGFREFVDAPCLPLISI